MHIAHGQSPGDGSAVFTRARHRLALIALAGFASLVAAGCSSGSHAQAFLPVGFTPDAQRFTLPLDSYLPDRDNDEFARNLLVQQCMQAARIGWPVPGLSSKSRAPSLNSAGRKLLTVPLAERYGYHSGPVVSRQDPLAGRHLTVLEQTTLDGCAKASNAKIGASASARSLVEALQYAAYQSASQDDRTRKLAHTWRACLLAKGVGDVPNDPTGMPTAADRAKWFGSPTKGETRGTIPMVGGPEEIRAATVDAKCRESSGWTAGSYQAEVDAQIKLMADNQTALERARANTQDATNTIQGVIDQRHG